MYLIKETPEERQIALKKAALERKRILAYIKELDKNEK